MICSGHHSAVAQTSSSPSIEINTSVLGEMAKQISPNQPSPNNVPALRRPTPAPSENTVKGHSFLTGRAIQEEPAPKASIDKIIPASAKKQPQQQKQSSNTNTITAPARLPMPEGDGIIVPKSKLENYTPPFDDTDIAIPSFIAPSVKSNNTAARTKPTSRARTAKIAAPLPMRKPVKAIALAKYDKLQNVPIPQKRPTIQKASVNFVKEKRVNLAANTKYSAPKAGKVTNAVKSSPLILKGAQISMPAAKAKDVIAEPLGQSSPQQIASKTDTPSRLAQHKNRIIDAVQKIASRNNEPEIDITAMAAKPAPNKNRIDAQIIRDITAIEPASGTVTSAKAPRPPVTSHSTTKGKVVTIAFNNGQDALDQDTKNKINAHILPDLQAHEAHRIQLQSYASSANDENNLSARRTSLSRALAARQYLISMGVEPRRVDIRPLGEAEGNGQSDRIDFFVFDPNNL
jgi:outer membrane protein OmpA-like peptidoglycan-associated protein